MPQIEGASDNFKSCQDVSSGEEVEEPWFESIDQIQFIELEDQDDWANYSEYLTISTIKDGLEKLKGLKDEYRGKIKQMVGDSADSMRAKMGVQKRKLF